MAHQPLSQFACTEFTILLNRYKCERPKPQRELDQFFAKEHTVLKRVQRIAELTHFAKKRILFLGDDDVTSIALALLYKTQTITVIDIDKKLLGYIQHIATNEKLDIQCIEHDLRNPLQRSQLCGYDIIFFDPPYTPQAVHTWLLRALEASIGKGTNKARKNPKLLAQKYYLLCYGYTDQSTERGLKIQKIITDLGLIIQEKIRGFNAYYEAKSIGSKSDLYILQPTSRINIRQLDQHRTAFYTQGLSPNTLSSVKNENFERKN
ncbi:MAG: hypothetical protein A3B74_03665 [Candidatus Kerfeldbacteria bacterium RIFCSPHIGHO2_02_FULL_42_14]|uniref:N(4)-bis(aminopropyl)spermidine synthase C-terminal domain-containing protein n=1 Tax=Candidatus Kerfeldbacteria bacterium RIFCSPHIGHO2_02_FULL_42_14 TaxID=1798540 RepID=A0A1G2AQ00_9BACT|nr:MAG: hypothetical protein A3B74_03665 [Candidatus Kerfeldbacteria bacterium RIFCSPHIGHO2_02_FULL_42_14]OGY80615.1 MAG: hypothetical protein A3E60_04165 [Candidatus Kerfeldbacteria bacterium RIFCSPHIGHO2_12_FULL_42_13]OGY82539.1 MAG: hypothetical protein A3I91_03825 [Candidatus Kerfeldbacteria bacterium RIFCSPLOWO2_02_FULL_42_19]OGY85143.1 MAG: hypothetical protein A3G01_00955 [Candidatus Kerfeldbacteria bacterium RIFCSPLOWO2_12_FULL_43_9]